MVDFNAYNFNIMSPIMPSSSMFGGFSAGNDFLSQSLFMPNFSMPNFNMPIFNFSAMNFNTTKPKHKHFKKMKFSEESNKKIDEISQKVGCSSKDLKALMYSESGGNPQAVNPKGGATGLIQFMPSTARELGTSVEELANMTAEQQLPYVEKYLLKAKKNAGLSQNSKVDAGTLYTLVFLPAYANKDVLCESDSKYYRANKGLDLNKDGLITKADLADRLNQFS